MLVDDGQPVGVGILYKTDRRAGGAHLVAELCEILGDRLGAVREKAGWLVVDVNQIASEGCQKRARMDSAGAVDAVEHDTHPGQRAQIAFDRGLHRFNVPLAGLVVGRQRFKSCANLAILPALANRRQARRPGGVRRQTALVQQLHPVPLIRIVAGGNDQTAVIFAESNRVRDGRRHRDTNVDHPATGGDQTGGGCSREHLAARP